MADGDMPIKKKVQRDTYKLGSSFVFPPHVMDDIHIKSELGRYRMRAFSLFKKFHIGVIFLSYLAPLQGSLLRGIVKNVRPKQLLALELSDL